MSGQSVAMVMTVPVKIQIKAILSLALEKPLFSHVYILELFFSLRWDDKIQTF